MVHLLRKHQQTLMIIITILVIITFVWFWNGNQGGRMDRGTNDTVATIYGRRISEPEAQREARKYYVALELGLLDLVQDLAGFERGQSIENFLWNLLVLRREADQLQIEPTDEEVKTALLGLRGLQTNGQFDKDKLAGFVQRVLLPRGFSETVIDDLVRDELRLKKVKALVSSSVELSPDEFRANYELQQQKMEASVIRFHLADFAAGITVSDDEAKQSYEQRKDQFKSDEKRAIDYVTFSLTDEQKALTGKERNTALGALANKAEEFTQAMLEKGAKFDEVAKKFELPVMTTGAFSEGEPDPQLAKTPALGTAAFGLREDDPNSDVVQGENGFHVLHLKEILPSKPLEFDEAKTKVVEDIKGQRARETLNLKAGEVRNKLLADLSAGKTFADAATAAGQTFETIPPFSLAEPAKAEVADQQSIMEKALDLGAKQLSDFVPSDDGGLLVFLEKREPVDPAKFEKDQKALEPMFAQQKREKAFLEWLRVRREAAKIQVVQR